MTLKSNNCEITLDVDLLRSKRHIFVQKLKSQDRLKGNRDWGRTFRVVLLTRLKFPAKNYVSPGQWL